MRSNLYFVFIFFVTSIVICVQCRQPSWNVRFQGDNLYALTTDSWQECGLLCTRNMQRTEDSIKSTTCSFWTWNDPSNREYNNVCRFHQEIYSTEYNGGAISGLTGCYNSNLLIIFYIVCNIFIHCYINLNFSSSTTCI